MVGVGILLRKTVFYYLNHFIGLFSLPMFIKHGMKATILRVKMFISYICDSLSINMNRETNR